MRNYQSINSQQSNREGVPESTPMLYFPENIILIVGLLEELDKEHQLE